MSGLVQTNAVIVLPYLATDINVEDSGKTFITPQTAGPINVTYTLPLPQAGLHFRFVNGAPAALAGDVNIATHGAANILFGMAISGPTGGTALLAIATNHIIRFASAESVLGDYIDLISDGTNYYVEAISSVGGSITVT